MIHGYDKAVATMEVGQTINIHLMPEEAYGMPDPRAIFTLEIAQLPGSEDLEVGTCISDQPVRTAIPGNRNRKDRNQHHI